MASSFPAFFGALVFSLLLTPLVRRIASATRIVDDHRTAPWRKIHTGSTALLGGLAVIVSFFSVTAFFFVRGDLFSGAVGALSEKAFWGLLIGAGVILIGGILDDRFNLKPGQQFVFPLIATLVIIASGIGILFITNPFGGILNLEQIRITLFEFGGVPYQVVLFADLFTFLWLLGAMYTTKFLDGLDGLVSGIAVIGATVIFFLTLRPDVAQPELAILAATLAGAYLGFLPFNFHRASIFLGESGSLFAGFMLGILAILAGGKISTALLILGIPILDVVWSIARRMLAGRSPVQPDRKHLHFRLLDTGLSHRAVVLLLWALTVVFGSSTLFVRGMWKAVVLAVLFMVMFVIAFFVVRRERNDASHKRHE